MNLEKNIINFLNLNKEKKIFFNVKKKYTNFQIKNFKNIFIIFKFKKLGLFRILSTLYKINKIRRIDKNLIIFYNFKREIVAQKLFLICDDKKYFGFFDNLYSCIKKNLYFYFKFKQISCIVVKFK